MWDFIFISFHLDHPAFEFLFSQSAQKQLPELPNRLQTDNCLVLTQQKPHVQRRGELLPSINASKRVRDGGKGGGDGLEEKKDPHIQLLIYYIKSYAFVNSLRGCI